jgi:hypothetical protein
LHRETRGFRAQSARAPTASHCPELDRPGLQNQKKDSTMNFSYFEVVMAFFGLASIVIGSFAERLTEHVLGEPKPTLRR